MFRALMTTAALALTTSLFAPVALAGPKAEAVIAHAAAELSEGTFDKADLLETLDTARIARFALGKYARQLETDDVQRFTAAFETFLANQFRQHGDALEGADIVVTGSDDRNARDSIVETKVTFTNGETDTYRWRVIERDGDWRIVDVEAYDLWLAIEQRAQIAAVLGRRGADANDAITALNVDTQTASTGSPTRNLAK